MYKKILWSVLLSAFTFGAYACDEGKDKLIADDCDVDTHVAICSTTGHAITQCINGRLLDVLCETQLNNSVCEIVDSVARCVLKGDQQCGAEYKANCEGNVAKTCVDGSIQETRCEAHEKCSDGACVPDTKTCDEATHVVECTDEGKLKLCESGNIVEQACPANTDCRSGKCECDPVSFSPVCKGGNTLSVCENGAVVDKTCEDDEVCDNNACVPATATCDETTHVVECTAEGKLKLCESGNIVEQDCPANTVCRSGKCECDPVSYPVCKDVNTLSVCENGAVVDKTCEDDEVCDNNACVPGTASCGEDFEAVCRNDSKVTCVSNVVTAEDCTASGKACSKGECVDVPAEGTACTGDEPEFCNGNYAVYCDGGEVVSESYFCDPDIYPPCDVVDDVADCYSTCTEAELGTNKLTCFNYYGYYFYSLEESCVKSDRGNLVYHPDYENAVYCDDGCDDTTGKCIKLHDEVGNDCDDNYGDKCDGAILLSCIDEKVKAVDCGEVENSKCGVSTDGVGECYQTCDNVDDTKWVCDEFWGMYFSDLFKCEELSDGTLGYVYQEESEMCSTTCNEATGQCVKLHDDEGKPCDSNYTRACTGDILTLCYGDTVRAVDCAEDGNFCATSKEGETTCYQTCAEANEETLVCDHYYGSSDTYKCFELEGDQLGATLVSYEECANECDDDTGLCVELHVDEGDDCTEENYPDKCTGEVLTYCFGDKVEALDCAGGVNQWCGIDTTGYGDCYSDCTALGDDEPVCEGYYNASVTYGCVSITEPSSKQFGRRMVDFENCGTEGCNDDTGLCE
ncbi:MAG: hypothetical protein ACOX8U_09310 [Bradymonadia bacterium]|jgi:hypothetical protein